MKSPSVESDVSCHHLMAFVFHILFQTVAIISIVFIIISTMVLTLNTLPYFSGATGENTEHEEDFPPFALLEAIYMSWFTFEFLV